MNDFEQIEKEIQRLETSDYVQLAIKADRTSQQRSRYLTWLRTQELRGRQLAAEGISQSYLDEIVGGEDYGF